MCPPPPPIVESAIHKACGKWFQQVVTGRQKTSCNKPDLKKLVGI